MNLETQEKFADEIGKLRRLLIQHPATADLMNIRSKWFQDITLQLLATATLWVRIAREAADDELEGLRK